MITKQAFYVNELNEGHLTEEFHALPLYKRKEFDLHFVDEDFNEWYKSRWKTPEEANFAPGKESVIIGEFSTGIILGNF